ncbi:winged helix DNA-binding protein [Streptomyces sp. NBC_01283]|uniref:LexA family protein n=1 Tax=Streptomyces sp. NBC_01283 TaxID=2903812 RepID=UPI00352CD059|nr:winged helix DNA-binding protein [Streptomyces sp. NBC_01283]
MSLTERQEQILRCIREAIAETGECPTLEEIGTKVGLTSKSAVHYQLKRLEACGLIARAGQGARIYRLA